MRYATGTFLLLLLLPVPARADLTVSQFLQLSNEAKVAVIIGVMESLESWGGFLEESPAKGTMTKVGACLGRQQFTYARVHSKVREMMMFAIGRDVSFATDRMKMDVPTTVLGVLADCKP